MRLKRIQTFPTPNPTPRLRNERTNRERLADGSDCLPDLRRGLSNKLGLHGWRLLRLARWPVRIHGDELHNLRDGVCRAGQEGEMKKFYEEWLPVLLIVIAVICVAVCSFALIVMQVLRK